MIYFVETETENVEVLLVISEVEILLPKTKPILVEIIYRSPSQDSSLEILCKNFPSIDTDTKETYILGDFNINMYENNKYIVHENNKVCTKFASADAKKYH